MNKSFVSKAQEKRKVANITHMKTKGDEITRINFINIKSVSQIQL